MHLCQPPHTCLAGNWDHMACRSINTSYRFDEQSNDGLLTHFHFSLTGACAKRRWEWGCIALGWLERRPGKQVHSNDVAAAPGSAL